MHELRSVRELRLWSAHQTPDTFPYDAVVDEFHQAGKHFVPIELLNALDRVRLSLGEKSELLPWHLLSQFLWVTLDKRDDRYDYPTYLALALLPLVRIDDGEDAAAPQIRHDRLLSHLVSDILSFELLVVDASETFLPKLRPSRPVLVKRCRLAVRAIQPALNRLGMRTVSLAADPIDAARDVRALINADLSMTEHRTLRLSILPVWVAHDEYMFIRVLQAFETTFALLAARLRAAVGAVTEADTSSAIMQLDSASSALHDAARFFPLLATMQKESFLTFRQYTEGASAIQSRNYKVVESLCGLPDPQRLASAAYLSVPEVRAALLAQPPNLDAALITTAGTDLTSGKYDDLVAAMRRFEATLLRWRQTHYRLAVRMLGDRSGTGYTEGTPYLRDTMALPVFRSIAADDPHQAGRPESQSPDPAMPGGG